MKVIFVTGAPGSGKTYVTNYICELMRINGAVAQISTDLIRHMQEFLVMDGISVGSYFCKGDDALDTVKSIVRAGM